jgi:lipid-binding SYLF domain-containing protein
MSRRFLMLTVACLTLVAGRVLMAQTDEADRVRKAASVLEEIMGAPDKAIPSSVLKKAEAIAVFPGTLKGGLGVGAHHGKGILSVRHRDLGKWSNPAFLTLTGGSFGPQIGGEQVDIVLVVVNRGGIDKLLGNEFKIGGDASVAAGPVGRSTEASTDIQLTAEILSYSRAKGLFAGASLQGSSIREDEDANQRYYGRRLTNREITGVGAKTVGTSGTKTLPGLEGWFDVLARYTK